MLLEGLEQILDLFNCNDAVCAAFYGSFNCAHPRSDTCMGGAMCNAVLMRGMFFHQNRFDGCVLERHLDEMSDRFDDIASALLNLVMIAA